MIGNIALDEQETQQKHNKLAFEARNPGKKFEKEREKNKMRGKNKPSKRLAKKQKNVVDKQRSQFEEQRQERITEAKERNKKKEEELFTRTEAADALDRFKKV